jgi:hypothetical protein
MCEKKKKMGCNHIKQTKSEKEERERDKKEREWKGDNKGGKEWGRVSYIGR